MKSPSKAFTFIELLVIIGTIALFSVIIVPTMAKAKNRSPAAGCLSNLRQLQIGWAMYADDNHGTLMSNAPAGLPGGWCGGGASSEDWHSSIYNTNPAPYLASPMGSYTSSNITVFRCPGDLVPSDNGPRIRSYSMNGQMAVTGAAAGFNPGWRAYTNESDLTCPLPKDAFIFCDEHPGSIEDGYFQLKLSSPGYPNVPASYLDGGCGFSFADGHAEIHKWKSPYLLIPVIQGVKWGGSKGTVVSSASDLDWPWLRDHSACNHF